jgi:hypothetical protein
MTIRWTPTALRDLETLHAYIAEDSDEATAAMVERTWPGWNPCSAFLEWDAKAVWRARVSSSSLRSLLPRSKRSSGTQAGL